MIEKPMPQDILKYKAKFIGNFSARQVVFLMLGAIGCAIGFFGVFAFIEEFKMKAIASAILGAPFFVFGFYQPFGQPLEKILIPLIIDNFLAPAVRKKEVHHPEFEKWYRKPEFIKEQEADISIADENAEGVKKAAKKKKQQTSTVRVKPSRAYKGIR